MPIPIEGDRERTAQDLTMTESQYALRPESTAERLTRKIVQTEQRLAELREAAGLLEKNPDVERLVTLLGKGL